MNGIDYLSVLKAGVAAGLVIIAGEFILNGVVLGGDWEQLRRQHVVAEPGPSQFGVGAVLTLSYGVVLVWMYAAMRPRFASSTTTALVAAFTFWTIAYALFLLSVWANGFITMKVAIVSILWGLIEAPVASLVGARVYGDAKSAHA